MNNIARDATRVIHSLSDCITRKEKNSNLEYQKAIVIFKHHKIWGSSRVVKFQMVKSANVQDLI